jgi:uncharacterized protein (UPF0335 family)
MAGAAAYSRRAATTEEDMSGAGHNGQLTALIERVERLEAEKSAIADDIREIYAEAKGNGFDPKMVRHLVRLRRMEESDRKEHVALRDTYEESVFG